MTDPYDILGVRRGDSDDTIRKAYRKLAKRYHPDLNPGKPEALERFKQINAANELLSDPEKRARYDRGEIDAEGHETVPPQYYQQQREPSGGPEAGFGGFSPEDLEGLFGQAFRSGGFGGEAFEAARNRGRDVHYSLTVDFLDAARGAVKRLSLPDGKTIDVTIPAGLRDGHILRLRGQGQPGRNNAPAGDALVEISVAPHAFFRREGDDIIMRLPVTLQEAILGGPVTVPTINGPIRLRIPPNSANGARLRLKGRGIGGGHQYVELAVTLPPAPEPALTAFLQDWRPDHAFDPRAGLTIETGEG